MFFILDLGCLKKRIVKKRVYAKLYYASLYSTVFTEYHNSTRPTIIYT